MNLPTDHDTECQRLPTFVKARNDLRGKEDNDKDRYYRRERWHWFWIGLPEAINRLTRHADRVISRSYHGVWQRRFMQAHSFVPTLFMLLAILFTALGPTPRFRGWEALAVMSLALVGYWAFARLWLEPRAGGHGRGLFVVQATLLTVLCAALFSYVGLEAPEARPKPYSNLFAPLMVALMGVAAIGYGMAWLVMRNFPLEDRMLLAVLLGRTELFTEPEPPRPSVRGLLHGIVNAPLYHPLHLLLMPALPMIVVPADWVNGVGLGGLGFAWLLLTFSGMYDRLSLMIKVVRQYFLIGGQLVVSLIVIGLAIARVADFNYVTTLLDTASYLVILCYVLAAYTALLLYEYWLNRALSERILPMLRAEPDTPARLAWIPYLIGSDTEVSRVEREGRAVELYAGGRFVITGKYKDPFTHSLCGQWQPLERGELFDRLAQSATKLPIPWSPSILYASRVAAAEIDKRAKLYFNVMNVLLVFMLAGAGWWLHTSKVPEAVAMGTRLGADVAQEQPVNLAQRVFEAQPTGRPAIMIAASGGGTRAALYTASVLRGIAALGRIDDVVLVSGVSGGSAALAYFAMHHDRLRASRPGACDAKVIAEIERAPSATDDPWCRYVVTMASPFIDDVLRGVSQVDVAGPKTMGHLLEGSFARRFGTPSGSMTLADVQGVGLILNTTLAGHPASESAMFSALWSDRAPGNQSRYAVHAGGRLIFTNLRDVGGFPHRDPALANAPADAGLPFVIVGASGVPLTAAASLSANFPPIFSNAAVDVRHAPSQGMELRRYWVTDGGAADNRGILSLQYAVRSMLQACKHGGGGCKGSARPIHLIVADASAQDLDYTPDRGAGAILGASTKFASQLMLEILAKDSNDDYLKAHGGTIELHHLSMPLVLRTRGGFGTHWSMPRSVTLRDICVPDKEGKASRISVSRLELLELIAGLHIRPYERGPTDRLTCPPKPVAAPPPQAASWLARDPHSRAWATLVEALARRDAPTR